MAVPVKVFSVLFTLFKRMDILLLMSFIPKNYDYGKTNTSFRKKQLIFSKPDLMNETFTVIKSGQQMRREFRFTSVLFLLLLDQTQKTMCQYG